MKIDDDPSQEKATYVTSGKGFMPIIRYFSALNQKAKPSWFNAA